MSSVKDEKNQQQIKINCALGMKTIYANSEQKAECK